MLPIPDLFGVNVLEGEFRLELETFFKKGPTAGEREEERQYTACKYLVELWDRDVWSEQTKRILEACQISNDELEAVHIQVWKRSVLQAHTQVCDVLVEIVAKERMESLCKADNEEQKEQKKQISQLLNQTVASVQERTQAFLKAGDGEQKEQITAWKEELNNFGALSTNLTNLLKKSSGGIWDLDLCGPESIKETMEKTMDLCQKWAQYRSDTKSWETDLKEKRERARIILSTPADRVCVLADGLKQDEAGMTPLHVALALGDFPEVNALFTDQKGEPTSWAKAAGAVDNGKRIPLHYAFELGRHQIVEKLLPLHKGGMSQRDVSGFTPLNLLCRAQDSSPHTAWTTVATIKVLRIGMRHEDAAEAVNKACTRGYTPLWYASRCAHDQQLLRLLRHRSTWGTIGMKEILGSTAITSQSDTMIQAALVKIRQFHGRVERHVLCATIPYHQQWRVELAEQVKANNLTDPSVYGRDGKVLKILADEDPPKSSFPLRLSLRVTFRKMLQMPDAGLPPGHEFAVLGCDHKFHNLRNNLLPFRKEANEILRPLIQKVERNTGENHAGGYR